MYDPHWRPTQQSLSQYQSWLTLEKETKKMSNPIQVVSKKIVRVLRRGTTRGKVDRLEGLTKSLTQNTSLVAQKYEELKEIEAGVNMTLSKITKEKFVKEHAEIDGLSHLKKEEKEKFKQSLALIRTTGIEELTPIGVTAQRIKAHMLITLNKALTQKAILVAKSKLAGNAHLQLETLRLVSRETKDINGDLRKLLSELDELNNSAINASDGYFKDVKDQVGGSDGMNAAESIVNKMENLGKPVEVS